MNVHDYAFCRVQSTMCEVGDMEKVLCELDANLLVSLALGYSCVVYDFGSRDKGPDPPRHERPRLRLLPRPIHHVRGG